MIGAVDKDCFVAACRAYDGVKFKHRGRSRAGGIDCAGLIICALQDLGQTPFDIKVYGREPYRDGLRQTVQKNLGEPVPKHTMKAGDILLMRFTKNPHHLGVVASHPADPYILTIIHADSEVGRVVEHRLDQEAIDRIVEVYRIPEIQETQDIQETQL